MATRFEIVLHGDDSTAGRAAGEEALDEIDRCESLLSLYRPTSEIAAINGRAFREPVRVSAEVFGLLERTQQLSHATKGAFDITVGPLMRCWGLMHGTGRVPSDDELAEARSKTGMHLVALDVDSQTVRFPRAGVMLDLGAIGKGYAIERAATLLREAGVSSAFIHGGTSTACAIGSPLDSDAWDVAVDWPETLRGTHDDTLATIPLKNAALSVSAPTGKSFQVGGKQYGHVIDPRSGRPVDGALLAAVVSSNATQTDALSTALLTLGTKGQYHILSSYSDIQTLIVEANETGGKPRIDARGIVVQPPISLRGGLNTASQCVPSRKIPLTS